MELKKKSISEVGSRNRKKKISQPDRHDAYVQDFTMASPGMLQVDTVTRTSHGCLALASLSLFSAAGLPVKEPTKICVPFLCLKNPPSGTAVPATMCYLIHNCDCRASSI